MAKIFGGSFFSPSVPLSAHQAERTWSSIGGWIKVAERRHNWLRIEAALIFLPGRAGVATCCNIQRQRLPGCVNLNTAASVLHRRTSLEST